MHIEEIAEKILLDPKWGQARLLNIMKLSSQERAQFFLALRSLPPAIWSLVTRDEIRGNHISEEYQKFKIEVIQAEAAGEVDLTEALKESLRAHDEMLDLLRKRFRQNKEKGRSGKTLSRQERVKAAIDGLKRGEAWPLGLTELVLAEGSLDELEEVAGGAPLTKDQREAFLALPDPYGHMPGQIYSNMSTPWEEVSAWKAAGPISDSNLEAMGWRLDLSSEAITWLITVGSVEVRATVIDLHLTEFTDEHFRILLDTNETQTHFLLAEEPDTPPWVLTELAKTPELEVQMALAQHPKMTTELLEELAKISEHLAAVRLERKLACGESLSKQDMKIGLNSTYKGLRVETIKAGFKR